MRFGLIASALVLASCSEQVEKDVPKFRDASVAISSSLRVSPDDLLGDWFTVYPNTVPENQDVNFSRRDKGIVRMHQFVGYDPLNLFLSYQGQGRFTAKLGGEKISLWVLWIDEDKQLLVLGSPDETWHGQILNRTPTLRADRLQAAKDILEFNGYDLSQLEMTPQ